MSIPWEGKWRGVVRGNERSHRAARIGSMRRRGRSCGRRDVVVAAVAFALLAACTSTKAHNSALDLRGDAPTADAATSGSTAAASPVGDQAAGAGPATGVS